ncbi:MAG: hypothetical protein RLZZ427_632 [Pseudomonadota bacterium]|jgi:signal transduction histidine kinase
MSALLATAQTDRDDRLISADEPLASLQLRCGGELPGTIAVPALLELVRKARAYGLKLARTLRATDGVDQISAWVEVVPEADGACAITAHSWQANPLPGEDPANSDRHRAAIDRAMAELTAQLDQNQRVLAVEACAVDTAQSAQAMRAGIGRPWTEFVTVTHSSHQQPLHWRLLDGARVILPGSARVWRVSLFPYETPGGEPAGFELCLVADVPLLPRVAVEPRQADQAFSLARIDVAPVLRQPLARIISNAETIRTRLAGPLADEYSQYAADITTAGRHLLSLVDDLADLSAVEADGFSTAGDRIDLGEVARSAAAILGARAQERGIVIDPPKRDERLFARGEGRRVLQILLNLLTNAVRYSGADSQVWIRLEAMPGRARVIVADQGPGLSTEQQTRVFDKFERLGRSDEAGTGLGLYISRRLAQAMGGNLTVESAPGQGARFILDLPAADLQA